MSTFCKDFNYGICGENTIAKYLENEFGVPLSKTKHYDLFDFTNDTERIYIEVKTRRNAKNKYGTTMVGLNKVVQGFKLLQSGYKIYFVFQFTDKNSYYKLDAETFKACTISSGGRRDRGRVEMKKYVYIPIELLSDFN